MGVLKDEDLKIENFSFRQLMPGDEGREGIDEFELKSLNSASEFKNNISEGDLRAERSAARESSFNFLNEVKIHRGLSRQEQEDYEKSIKEEVERRIEEVRVEAYREGLEKGMLEGKEQAYQEAKVEMEQNLDHFVSQVEATGQQIESILLESKLESYNIVKNLAKWIVLKEVDEKYYLSRLLEKLVHEINQKHNLVLHVNEKAFGYMPEIIKLVERKVGKLNNVRIEVDPDLEENGIKLETENCIIDGSLKAQFEAIDDLFKSVGLDGAK